MESCSGPQTTESPVRFHITSLDARSQVLLGVLHCVVLTGLAAIFTDHGCFYLVLGTVLSLLLGVAGMPDGRSGVTPMLCTRISIASGIIITTWASILCWWSLPQSTEQIRFIDGCTQNGHRKWWVHTSFCFASAPLAALFVLKWHPPSDYARSVVWCAVSLWFLSVTLVLLDACYMFGSVCPADIAASMVSSNMTWAQRLFFVLFAFMDAMFSFVIVCWIQYMTLARLKEYEAALGMPLGTKQLRWLFVSCLLLGAALTFHDYLAFAQHWIPWGFNLCWILSALIWFLILLGYTVPLRLVLFEARRARGVSQVEALWAKRGLRREFVAITISSICWAYNAYAESVVRSMASDPTRYPRRPSTLLSVNMTICFIEVMALGVFSGVLWQQGNSMLSLVPPPCQRQDTRATTHASMKEAADLQRLWDEKVAELAGRGVTVEALLDFLQLLLEGQVMPSFDAGRSTTNDVVRQAIIPLSCDATLGLAGSALATIWNQGRALQPERMVTHNWSNKFVHLVGAVVAESLGKACYNDVVAELSNPARVNALRERLQSQNALHRAYWICAFSVNQHASICSDFGPAPTEGSPERTEWEAMTCDTVTGARYPLCRCNTTKFLNQDPVLSELNKFPDVMSYLFTRIEGFAQIVAVDEEFQLFSRAWCVAELVEADGLSMPQHVKIHSYKTLDQYYHLLETINVQNCNASRQEDKTRILANIKDLGAFNERLQWLIYGTEGLFRTWMDGRERAKVVGRIASRALMRQQTRADDIESGSG